MENDSSLRVSSSIRRDASDIFSPSSFEEDDEEALKWAALDKLPTYNRLKKGLLTLINIFSNSLLRGFMLANKTGDTVQCLHFFNFQLPKAVS